jgi:hypothetical protein
MKITYDNSRELHVFSTKIFTHYFCTVPNQVTGQTGYCSDRKMLEPTLISATCYMANIV